MKINRKDYILDTLERIRDETHQNNIMLRQLIKYFNKEISYASRENEEDFIRNILANLISNNFDISRLFNRRK